MTMCFVARGGKLFLLDSHFHPDYGGAMIGVSDISGTESFLAKVKEILHLRDNSCSVTYVRFNCSSTCPTVGHGSQKGFCY